MHRQSVKPAAGFARFGLRTPHPVLVVGGLLLLALVFRLAFLPFRWVGPDEGSYLMDARLILDGKVPIVDFAARQPLFLWLLAALFKLISPSLTAARIMLLSCNVGTGLLVYAIGRRLFERESALAGTAVFLLFPFSVVWSLSVITETLAVLLACASALLLLLAWERRTGLGYALAAGMAAAAAYFTRETAVWVMAVLVLYSLFAHRSPFRRKATIIGALVLGYLIVGAAVWAYYARYLSMRELVFSRLNPLDVVLSRIAPGPYSMTPTTSEAIGAVQALDDIETYVHEIFAFGLFGFVGAILAVPLAWRRSADSRSSNTMALLLLWLGVVVAMYAVRFAAVEQVVFARYLLEMLPPLALLFAFSLGKLLPMKRGGLFLFVVLLLVGVYAVQHATWQHFPGAGVYFLAGAVLAVALWSKGRPGGVRIGMLSIGLALVAVWVTSLLRVRPPFGIGPLVRTAVAIALWVGAVCLVCRRSSSGSGEHLFRLVGLTLVLFAFLYSVGKQGQKIGPSYEGVWSPGTVTKATQLLVAEARPGDVVLSGGQIWTFQAGLDCFLDITHTLGLLYVPDSVMQRALTETPPRFIVMDGYTEKRTSPHRELLASKLSALYAKAATVGGSPHPVEIYRLRDDGKPAAAPRTNGSSR
ncbi:MAG: glycosyltransferase family 39 protein [Calditrichaeota bacterium]|nr:glycosyltransferase family 39 protein [Calditrichota bacterium]